MARRKSLSITLSILAAVAMALGTGCGGGPPVETSKSEATVHGKVIIHGKPVKKGQVWFDPANYRRKDVTARSTNVAEDGTYAITTLIGENSVRYEGPATLGNRELDGAIQSLVVKEGDNEFDIILPLR
ncbi:MAG: hypothetical protein IRY99_08025 [Isosphaeraceae bacterium]|nr:hypothetical protein [Isosphaeraceae bacterium]